MNSAPVIVDQAAPEWESWPPEEVAQRGESEWKTLISGGLTRSEGRRSAWPGCRPAAHSIPIVPRALWAGAR